MPSSSASPGSPAFVAAGLLVHGQLGEGFGLEAAVGDRLAAEHGETVGALREALLRFRPRVVDVAEGVVERVDLDRRGDEANLLPRIPGYVVVNARAQAATPAVPAMYLGGSFNEDCQTSSPMRVRAKPPSGK